MNPSQAWGWWVAAAAAGGLTAARRSGWQAALGALVGLGLGSWAFALGGMLLGVGYQTAQRWRQHWAVRDEWDSEVEQFLEQLLLVAEAEPSLARAVDRALPPHLRPLARRLDTLGKQLAAVWPVPALSQASRAWQVLAQHGGSVGAVAHQMLAQLRLDRRLRWERAAALAGGRGTVSLLAAAPLGVVLLFWGMVPSFYTVMVTTAPGQAAMILAGGVGWGVLGLAHREREEGGRA